MKRLLALLAVVAASVAATATVEVSPALANGTCSSDTYASYSKLSGVANSYTGSLRLSDADSTGGGAVSFAVGGSTHFIRVWIHKVAGDAHSFEVGVDSDTGASSSSLLYIAGGSDTGQESFNVAKDPAPATTWSATITDPDLGLMGVIYNLNLGGTSPSWTEARAWIPTDFPCQVMTADVTTTSMTSWTRDASSLGPYYTASLLSSGTLFRTQHCGC